MPRRRLRHHFCQNAVVAGNFFATSDEGIKSITGRSDSSRDLALLQGIGVTD